MSEVHKILIIENQFEHFSKLYKGLTSSGELVVIPSFENNDKKPYIGLMSAVKVFVNGPGYSKKYRNECWEIIKETLIDKEGNCSVDLIIMDNKLGGATVCQDGLDMAKLIWNINDNSNITKTIPILFLSRTDYSDEKRFTMFEEFRKNGYRFDWLMKGFLGNKPLEDGFIQITVKNKILELLTKESPAPKPENPNEEYISIIEKVLASDTPPTLKVSFSLLAERLKSGLILNGEEKIAKRLRGMDESQSYYVGNVAVIEEINSIIR